MKEKNQESRPRVMATGWGITRESKMDPFHDLSKFQKVYTMTDYYDGPRGGIADYRGKHHVYESLFDDFEDDHPDTFLLMPIDDALFRLALEDWEIWLKWKAAFHQGRTTLDTHPALPEDRKRHEELKARMGSRLKAIPAMSFRVQAEFRCSEKKETSCEFEVRWIPIDWEEGN